MMNGYFILDENKKVVPAKNIYEWGAFFQVIENRRIGLDKVGTFEVSTVFIGIDHNWNPESPYPLLFETMVFSSERNVEYCNRYTTYTEALNWHKKIVKDLQATLIKNTVDKPDTIL